MIQSPQQHLHACPLATANLWTGTLRLAASALSKTASRRCTPVLLRSAGGSHGAVCGSHADIPRMSNNVLTLNVIDQEGI